MDSQHPRHIFRHCPRCGADGFTWRTDGSFFCAACEFVYYINAGAAVAALIEDDGRLLLVRRARDPQQGTLDLPGGFVDPGEPAEQALIREVREETCLEVSDHRLLGSWPNRYVYGGLLYHTLDLAFVCRVRDYAHLRPGDDAAETLWVPLDEINPEEIGLESIRRIVETYLDGEHR